MVRSVTAKKCHQKKPLLLSSGTTERRNDSMAQSPYLCSLCKCILKYVAHDPVTVITQSIKDAMTSFGHMSYQPRFGYDVSVELSDTHLLVNFLAQS